MVWWSHEAYSSLNWRLSLAHTNPASSFTWRVVNLSLQDLGQAPKNSNLALAGYYTLVEYLIASYGRDIVPTMLENLGDATTLENWLRLVTGQGIEEVEPNWQRWVYTHYGQ